MYSTNERGIRNPNAPAGTAAGQAAVPTYGQSAASGPAPTTAGPHRNDVLNKLDPRVDSTADRQPMPAAGSNKAPEGTYGPHRSRIANALDPRVDSDMDGRGAGAAPPAMQGAMASGAPVGAGGGRTAAAAGPGAGVGGVGAGARGAGAGAAGVPEGTYGPHSSRVANALDPRVDSDLDRRGAGTGVGATTGAGVPTAAGAGTTSSTTAGTAGVGGAGVSGPHSSNLLNKLDPRVDSKTGTWKPGAGPSAGAGAGTGTRGI